MNADAGESTAGLVCWIPLKKQQGDSWSPNDSHVKEGNCTGVHWSNWESCIVLEIRIPWFSVVPFPARLQDIHSLSRESGNIWVSSNSTFSMIINTYGSDLETMVVRKYIYIYTSSLLSIRALALSCFFVSFFPSLVFWWMDFKLHRSSNLMQMPYAETLVKIWWRCYSFSTATSHNPIRITLYIKRNAGIIWQMFFIHFHSSQKKSISIQN